MLVLTKKDQLLKFERCACTWLACGCRALVQEGALHADASPALCCAVQQACAWTSHKPKAFLHNPVLTKKDQLLKFEQCACTWLACGCRTLVQD
jgi:hypothetical protein